MARELDLEVISTADSRGLDKAAKDLKGLKGETDKAAKSAHGLGDGFNDAEHDAFDFTAQIEKTRASIKTLSAEFSSTGDKGLLGDLRKERSFLSQLEKVAKELENAGPDGSHGAFVGAAAGASIAGARAGSSFSEAFIGAVEGIPEHAKPILIGGLVGLAAALSPAIGAMVGGALAGGVGTLGIAAGILSAAHDERVKTAARSFGHQISKEFFGAGNTFVEPVIESLQILEKTFTGLNLKAIFNGIAPQVVTIATGLSDLVKNTMPGLTTALGRMGPFADVAAKGFGQLGKDFSSFLDDITSSHGALMGLDFLFNLLGSTIKGLGVAINVLSDIFDGFIQTSGKTAAVLAGIAEAAGQPETASRLLNISRLAAELGTAAHITTGGVDGLSGGLGSFAAEASKAAGSAAELKEQWDLLNGKVLTTDEAAAAAYRAVHAVREEFERGTKSIQGFGEESVKNRLSLDLAGQAAVDFALRYRDSSHDIEGAERLLADLRLEIEKGTGATGDARRAIHEWLADWVQIPKGPVVPIIKPKIVGLSDLERMNYLIASIARSTSSGFIAAASAGLPNPHIDRRASGGPVTAGHLYQVNEQGVELFKPAVNGWIAPHSAMSARGNDGAQAPTNIVLTVASSGETEWGRLMAAWLQNYVHATAGGNVQLAFGRR